MLLTDCVIQFVFHFKIVSMLLGAAALMIAPIFSLRNFYLAFVCVLGPGKACEI